MDQKKIGFIGGGNMATALIGGLLDGSYRSERIRVSDIDQKILHHLSAQYGVETSLNNQVVAQNADVLILAVKPQVLESVLTQLGGSALRPGTLVISIVAGIREKTIEKWLGASVALIRAMPNTPALIRAGATALHANPQVTNEQRNLAESILRSVGTLVWLESESRLDVVTALSGSGPAYFFLFMEALEESALKLGLDQPTARLLIEQTAYGAARIALEVDESPAQLRKRVTSPGGTTQQAMEVFEKGGFRNLVAEALSAACRRSIEISREFGGE
ncbi:MAG: pyrroline-5-carboxylate reductase [Methylococcales bacterium]